MYAISPLAVGIASLILAPTTYAAPPATDNLGGIGPETTWNITLYDDQQCAGNTLQNKAGSGNSFGCVPITGQVGSVSAVNYFGIYNYSFFDTADCTADSVSPAVYTDSLQGAPDCITLGVFYPKSFKVDFVDGILRPEHPHEKERRSELKRREEVELQEREEVDLQEREEVDLQEREEVELQAREEVGSVERRLNSISARELQWGADTYTNGNCSYGTNVQHFNGTSGVCQEWNPDDTIKAINIYAEAGDWSFFFHDHDDALCKTDFNVTRVDIAIYSPLAGEGTCVPITGGKNPRSFYVEHHPPKN